MKKITIFLAIIAFSLSLSAQLVIPIADLTPAIGDEWESIYFNENSDISINFNEGDAGEDITWDFSGISGESEAYKRTWIDPTTISQNILDKLAEYYDGESTHTCELFMDESLVETQFYLINNEGFAVNGFINQNANGFLIWNTPLSFFGASLQYGEFGSDDNVIINLPEVGEVPLQLQGSFTWEVDAEGILTLPNGEVKDALRLKTYLNCDAYMYMGDEWVPMPEGGEDFVKEYEYKWFVEGTAYPAIYYINDEANSFKKVRVAKAFEAPSSVSKLNSNINIYPNPTSGIINIEETINSEILITDITGKIIFNGINITKIDLSNQPKGLYLLKISSNNKTRTQKIILQ